MNEDSKFVTLLGIAIDVMDEAGSIIGKTKSTTTELENKLNKTNQKRKNIIEKINEFKIKEDYKKVDEKENELREINKQIKAEELEIVNYRKEHPITITSDNILNVVSTKTGIPVNKLTSDDKKILATLNERLKAEVIGQDEAIDVICKAIKRNRVGFSKKGCLYSSIMIGKSGVGKTLTAKKLAKEMFGEESALVRFDMSEFADRTSVNKLIGSSAGYVGYDEGGLLTEAIKNKKYCVLLLDEIEKADPQVYNIFLQVLDEGFLTDNSGMKVDFSNVIVLFTSNIGTKAASDFGKGIGFTDSDNSKKVLTKELKSKFPPEFLNRLDNIVYFNKLNDDNLKQIIILEINKLQNKVTKIGYDLKYTDDVVYNILNIVKEEVEFGARPVVRAIQTEIEDKITDLLLENSYEQNHVFNAYCENNEILVK